MFPSVNQWLVDHYCFGIFLGFLIEHKGHFLVLYRLLHHQYQQSSDDEVLEQEIEADFSTYIERHPLEYECYQTIDNLGSLLRIKGSKGMGKTLLIDKVSHQPIVKKYQVISLSLLLADSSILSDINAFLRWFCLVISKKLKLDNKLEQYWEEGLGYIYNCTTYFEEYILHNINYPLILALDDVDQIFSYRKIADNFFSMLRAWHEEAKINKTWQKLRLILAYSTEQYIPADINQSPFNVGVEIELRDFDPNELVNLANKYHINLDNNIIENIMNKIGGHPYLLQKIINSLNREDTTVEKLLETATTDHGIFKDHLRGHLLNLQQYPELAAAMKTVVSKNAPIPLESKLAFKLHSLGLVEWKDNQVKPRYRLYADYFCDRL
ncbi:AAA-like domain-containing protein [Crocosphaera sp. XPORK-15E]|uniref:AAA-like domain-containing protein n=1 Tax=Crocosphaera sp. XPORK-15E TaxID=3110247 RepID=UPI002B20DBF2|nr:AAA-like domain-containing protein [Crocosphaera sp. XPORK-15E]MEA5537270.1 AAA-like domain-containing protein [Crocosphaera sp. XPORK-15E]